MLSTKTRLILQDILKRLSRNEAVSLEERILLKKHADETRLFGIGCKADPFKQKDIWARGVRIHADMNLPGQLSEDHYNGSQDDLGDWFQGSPEWVRRS